jgi:hypothetical protein
MAELGCGNGLGGVDGDTQLIGDAWDDLGDFAADAVATVAPIGLAVVGSVIAPGIGTALGGLAGSAIGKAVGGSAPSGVLGAAINIGSGIVTGDVSSIVKGGVSLGAQGLSALGGGGGPVYNGQPAAPAPRTTPYVIDKPGWRLDAANGQWCYDAADYCTPAVIGDRNSVTGEVYTGAPAAQPGLIATRSLSSLPRTLTTASMLSSANVLRALALKQPAQPQTLAAPVQPAPAAAAPAPAKWSTGKKVAGVGAALGLGYAAWRIAALL